MVYIPDDVIQGLTPKPKPPAPAPSAPSTSTQTMADQALLAVFRQYGLETLATHLVDYARRGLGMDEAYLELRNTTEYKQRFVGNAERQKNGWPLLSEAEYLSKESSIRSIMQEKYGLPPGFYDQPDDFAKAIGANLGGQELDERLAARKAIVEDGAATGVLAYAKEQYGLTSGDLIAFFIDPDRAAPVLNKMAAASQVGAAAQRARFGALSLTEAEKLADLGVTADQAQNVFSEAAGMAELTSDLGGTDTAVSRDDLLKAGFEGDAGAKARVVRKAEERKAVFQGGGGFAQSRDGFAGLGRADG